MPDARDHVLLVTHRGDHYAVDRVAEELVRRGARPRRIDSDGFPAELRLTTTIHDDPQGRRVLHDAEGAIDGEQVRAVWLRRLWRPRLDEELDPSLRDGCIRESRAALVGFLDGFRHRRVVNPLDRDRAALDKLQQLRIARELGLTIPRTLVTNDPDQVLAFHDAAGGRLVTKMLTPLSQSMGGHAPLVRTNELRPEDLEELDGLRHSPMVFQEQIDKSHELRVAVVDAGGGRCLAAAIDATTSREGRVDWRKATPAEVGWRPASLPDALASSLLALVRALGLVYGAADLIVTPDGRHVFLELNPAGEWGMLERDAGLPVAAAIADALMESPR
ncbi:MAG: MvdC family ATP-grasp ribosomal peptide maturase [Myxococcales bacterium]|nr:MvdC family ATP-grasp ribosomal peptide maturase [Myxococcales bacterium]